MGPRVEAARVYRKWGASSKGPSSSASEHLSPSADPLADRQVSHLLRDVPYPLQAALAAEERHGLEEAGADGAARGGEAQGVYKVASALLFLRREASDGLLDGFLGPLGEGPEALGKLGKVLPDKVLAELLLELGLVVVEGAAVEVSDGGGDLDRQGDALFKEVHDLLQARPVGLQLLLRGGAGLDEHGGRQVGQLRRGVPAQVDGVYGAELVLVEDGRVAADAVDAEALRELVAGKDLLVRGVAGAEQRQVVEQRVRQVALRRELLDVRRAVALGQFLPVRAQDHRDVGEGRQGVAQGLVDQDLARRVR